MCLYKKENKLEKVKQLAIHKLREPVRVSLAYGFVRSEHEAN